MNCNGICIRRIKGIQTLLWKRFCKAASCWIELLLLELPLLAINEQNVELQLSLCTARRNHLFDVAKEARLNCFPIRENKKSSLVYIIMAPEVGCWSSSQSRTLTSDAHDSEECSMALGYWQLDASKGNSERGKLLGCEWPPNFARSINY